MDAALDSGDPRQMAKYMRQMGAEAGDEIGPECEETVRRMEKGEMPEDLMNEGGVDGSFAGGEEA